MAHRASFLHMLPFTRGMGPRQVAEHAIVRPDAPAAVENQRKRKYDLMNLYDTIVHIEVGGSGEQGSSTSGQVTFEIHNGLLRNRSTYFDAALSKAPVDRTDFVFPDDDPEVFRYITLWLYSGKLFEVDNSAVSAELEHAIAGYDSDETMSDDATKNGNVDAHLSDAHESNSINHYPENTTNPPSPATQQKQPEPASPNQHTPSQTPITPRSDRSSPRPNTPPPQTPTPSPLPPTIPLSPLTLTKIYALAETLGITTLCNSLIPLLATRLSDDKTLPLEALIYAFSARCQPGSRVRDLLVDFAARGADMEELVRRVGAEEFPGEMLVALLRRLGPLRRVEGVEWEGGGLGRYCI